MGGSGVNATNLSRLDDDPPPPPYLQAFEFSTHAPSLRRNVLRPTPRMLTRKWTDSGRYLEGGAFAEGGSGRSDDHAPPGRDVRLVKGGVPAEGFAGYVQ